MRALVQRVSKASVSVNGDTVGACDAGLLILVCAMQGDTETNSTALAAKIAKLRIFRDDAGRMNRSLLDIEGSALVVSQFTLSADTRSGNRPGFSTAAAPEIGQKLYEHFSTALREQGIEVSNGIFGADMAVSLVNDGPVTLMIEK